MRSRQFATVAAMCGAAAVAAWDTPRFDVNPLAIESVATPMGEPDATGSVSSRVETLPFDAPFANAMGSAGAAAASEPDSTEAAAVSTRAPAAETPVVESADAPAAETPVVESADAPAADTPVVAETPATETPVVEARLFDSPPTPPEKPVRLVSAFPSHAPIDAPMPAARPLEAPKDCLLAEICIDEYLWSVYERTPKLDTNKVTERIKKTVKKKGKLRTVMTTIVKYVVGDFTWKDPTAAQKAGLSLKEYVIGGMDPGFKRKLYRGLRALEDAGFMPGITSAFRDDYRQAIAEGNKAASDSSYHGGSRRGGYGHGLAVDLVSVKGETRLERYGASDEMWKWIDAHEKELGIGRPYRDRDPPHIGAIDGKEYVEKRAWANVRKAVKAVKAVKAKVAKAAAKVQTKKHAAAARSNPAPTKRAPEKPSKVSSLQTRAAALR